MDKEIWRPAPGCFGIDVSNLGRVRNRWGKILRGHMDKDGYRLVHVRLVGGEYRKKYVHRMVLEAFEGPCPPGMQACHWDDVPTNNALGNLRWATASENAYDRVRNGSHNMARKTHCPRGHELAEGNLVASQRRRGNRSCLACARAHSYAHKQGWDMPKDSAEYQALSDSYFAALGIEEQTLDGAN